MKKYYAFCVLFAVIVFCVAMSCGSTWNVRGNRVNVVKIHSDSLSFCDSVWRK